LANVNAIDFKETLPSEHQATLTHSGQELFAANGRRQIGEIEARSPHRHGPRGADNNIVALIIKFGALAHQLDNAWIVQVAAAAGKYTGA